MNLYLGTESRRIFASRLAAASVIPATSAFVIEVLHNGVVEEYVSDDTGSDLTTADGRRWRLQTSGGGGGAGSGAVVSEVPSLAATPYIQSARLVYTAGGIDVRFPVGYLADVDVRHFGVVMTAHNAPLTIPQATANLVAFQAALDWASANGGVIRIPAGRLDIYGPAVLPIGAAVVGAGRMQTKIVQRQQPQSLAEGFTDVLTSPPVTTAGTGNGYNLVSDLTLNGGWNLRDHATATNGNWVYDPARMTQRAVVFATHSSGTGASAVRGASSDAHCLLHNVMIEEVAGYGFSSTGRGENFFLNCNITKCGIAGFYLDSPDCWINNMTSYVHGDTGSVITGSAGDFRMANSKLWFTGMQISAQPNGAGIRLPNAGGSSFNFSNVTTQDTWGPGLDLSGTYGINFRGAIDGAGGGRLRNQGFGYAGARTDPRSCVKANGTLRGAEIKVHVKHGGQLDSGASQAPSLAYLAGSSIMNNLFEFRGDMANMSATRVATNGGFDNSVHYNEVWLGWKLLRGYVTQANLDNASHGVNDTTYGPTRAFRDDGRMMVRSQAGAWVAQGA